MLDFLRTFFWRVAGSPATDNTAKGMAVGGGSLSFGSIFTVDAIVGIIGAVIAILSLIVSVYFGRLRAREMKRSNDLKERELDLKSINNNQE